MRSSLCLLILSVLVIVSQYVSCLAETEKTQLSQDGESLDAVELRRTLRMAYEQQLAMLQEAEENLTSQIEALQHQRQRITQRKRSHYMCLVNLITCYKRRK